MRKLPRGIIISCQLEPGDPVQDVSFIVNMARSADYAGAVAVRTNNADHVRAVKDSVNIPVIGLVKDRNYQAFITPTFEHARDVIKAGADFVAIDCTRSERPVQLKTLFEEIRSSFPDVGIIADIADEADAELVSALRPDFIATTLCGYTPYTLGCSLPNIELVRGLSRKMSIPIIAEGGYTTLEEVQNAFQNGAYAVVIGTAITRPWITIKKFVDLFYKKFN
ncbi:putative N-acetylmannosamine-6-phosphate 2-epimerase [Pseudothermotoga sp.]|uniref:N-acetylmannosamine-6-phosphate 2-epimerase n=1 Tax=Pseudothermotoga sp. TaxID=2033661 RepID=UPI00258CF7B2|nr:putative N-acetylmannosamine-6-phosphate 2-epimerase [Pseudothermotoga sp.]MDK2885291.1 N-acylglucosamine-6-phosphate 2-epimerase [Pseudothermotoga sp.]